MKRPIDILLLTAVLAGFAGCGGGAEDQKVDGDSQATQMRDAGVNFARCMRENGVDMPDPKTDENGVVIENGDDPSVDQPAGQFRAAEEKCRKYLDELEPPKMSAQQQSEFRKQALAHAACMREHGVDFPDPKFSEDGSVIVDLGPDSGLNPDSPAFQKAQDACRKLAGGPMAAPAGGGS